MLRPFVLALAVAVVAAGLASAASTLEAAPVLADPEGDVVLEAAAQGQGPDPGAPPGGVPTGAVDLVSLAVEESPDHVVFLLNLRDLAGDSWSFGTQYGILFEWDDSPFRVRIVRSAPVDGSAFLWAELESGDDDGDWGSVADLDAEEDTAAGVIRVSVPRVLVVSADGHAPVKDDALTDVAVTSSSGPFGGSFLRFRATDEMPDSGAGEYAIRFGGASAGHLLFETPDPIRVSNGESTTFVFEAHLHNELDAWDEVALEVTDVPADWNARVQARQRLSPGNETPIVVLVSVPFRHEHGGFTGFNLTATSLTDPSAFATAQLGVLHTPVAMPAGHHPDLFLHARYENSGVFADAFPFTSASMSTESDHSEDAPYATVNRFGSDEGWRIPLAPALSLGLDWRGDEPGALVGAIRGHTVAEGSVSAELWLTSANDDEPTLIASAKPVTVALMPEEDAPFALVIEPKDDADYVPYARDQNLVLTIGLDVDGIDVCCFGSAGPRLVVEPFKLTLPLNEYHDRLTGDAALKSSVWLDAAGPVERAARPGRTVTFPWNVTNAGAEAEEFALELAGSDAELGLIAPRGPIRLDAGEQRAILLGVTLPFEAAEGQTFEVLVVARSVRDPSVLAVGRTLTAADWEAPDADEAEKLLAAEERTQETPLPLALAVAALGAAAFAFASRRGGRPRA